MLFYFNQRIRYVFAQILSVRSLVVLLVCWSWQYRSRPGHVDVEYGIDQGYARREEHEETVRGIIREPHTQHTHGEKRVRAPRDEGRRKRPDILRNAGAIFGPITLPAEQWSHDRPCHEQAEVRRRRQQNRAETDNNR